jgi:hypothetical protein
MSLAELLSGRVGLAGRLPQRLDELRGPSRGVVVLPRHLSWPGMREFDVTDDTKLRRWCERRFALRGEAEVSERHG